MLINPAEIVEDEMHTVLQSVIEHSGKQEKLWYSVDKKYGKYFTVDKLDGFLVGVLPLAMALGEDIIVKGAMSEKLYHNLINYYMRIYQLAIPSIKPVKIMPDSLDDGKKSISEGAVGTGFSGGIDSFYTIINYLLADDVLPHYKITHIIFANVGSHQSANPDVTFNSRYQLLKGFPEKLGIDYIKIDSNLNDILQMNYGMTFQSRILSSPLLLQRLFSKYYIAAGFRYQDSFVGEITDIGQTNASAIHLLSTETLECISSGSELSRVEKTRLIAQSGVANRWLNVCTLNPVDGKNCSTCTKCCRTLFTLELMGALEQFSGVFDLRRYRRARTSYIIGKLLHRYGDHLASEIVEYIASINYKIPVWQRATARIFNLMPVSVYNFVKETCKSVVLKQKQVLAMHNSSDKA